MIRAAAVIAAKDLRQTFRSGYFVVMGIVAPVVLAIVFHVVFGSAASGRLEAPVGYADRAGIDQSAALGDVLASLDEAGTIALTVLGGDVDPSRALDDESLRAVIVADPASTAAGLSVSVVADPDAPLSVGLARSIASGFVGAAERGALVASVAADLGLERVGDDVAAGVSFVDRDAATRLDLGAQLGASMSTLFLLLISLLGVTGLLYERDGGTLARLLAAPIPRAAAIIAKVAVSVALGWIAGLGIVAATSIVIDASWGPTPAVALLLLTFSAAAAGLTLLISGAAPTTTAATNTQSTVAVLLAIVGGGLIPLPDGGAIGVARRLTPHHWLLDGLDSMAVGSAGSALPAIGALALFAVVLGGPGVVLVSKRLTR